MADSRGHKPVSYDDFRGDFNRSLGSNAPLNYWLFSQNIIYRHKSFGKRPGVTASVASPANTPVRFFVYQRTDEATTRYIILKNNGEFYDSGSATPSTPILTVASAEDFRMVVVNNRCYICPYKYDSDDQAVPISGEFVYVYDGTNAARKAAGAAPSGGTMAAATGAAGNVEAGRYIIAVAFETNTGFITPWGPATRLQYTAPGGAVISLTNINTGTAGVVVARWIGISKPIIAWNGNPKDYELFKFLRIADNTTTSATLNFFTADLINSGGYLEDELAEIPSGVNIALYNNRLAVMGEYASESLVRFSLPGDYESFDSVDGKRQFYPGDGGGLKNGVEYGLSFYTFKSARCYVTQDNGLDPIDWPVGRLEGALGAEPHSIAMPLDSISPHKDIILVANRTGIYNFNGRFGDRPLSWSIEGNWNLIGNNMIPQLEVAFCPFGPFSNFALIACSLDNNTNPDRVLYMDFSEGLNPDSVKWSSWVFARHDDGFDMSPLIKANKNGIIFGFRFTTTPSSYLCQLDSTIIGRDKFHPADTNSLINSIFDVPYLLPNVHEQGRFHLGAILILFGLQGTGIINTFISVEKTWDASASGPNFTIPIVFNNRVYEVCDFESEALAVRFFNNTVDQYFDIRGLAFYIKPSGVERPV